MNRRHFCSGLAALALLPAASAHAAEPQILKFATLAPAGSTWMKAFDAWGREVEQKSAGRLKIRFYPGGVSGDEPDMLRKIRFGQLHGAALSGHGIGEIYSPARILEAPFLYRNLAEVDVARRAALPDIETGLRAGRYELLAWMEVGNVHVFSSKPLASMDELSKRRIWQWQGDRFIGAFFDANGWPPVSLPITEVYTALSTGLLDTVVSTPLASIALQWAGKTPYMGSEPLTTGIGAVLVSDKFFQRLAPDLQALLKSTGATLSARLIADTRRDDQKALAVLAKSTRPLQGWEQADKARYRSLARQTVDTLAASGYLSPALNRKVDAALAAARKTAP